MGALNSLIKYTGNAVTKSSEKALANAVEKTTTKAITKMAEDFGTKAVTNGVTKALTKGGVSASKAALSNLVKNASLSGAGKSSLATKAGSTLDGILGKSSGVALPSAKKPTLKDYDLSLGGVADDFSVKDLQELGVKNKALSKLQDIARDGAEINNSAFDNTMVGNKSNLPMLNRGQYYYDTIGKVGNGNVSYEDIPDYMRGHLSNNVDKATGNDTILREFFNDNESDLSDLYDRYDQLAQANNQNRTLNRADIEMGLGVRNNPKEQADVEQAIADAISGSKDIPVSKMPSENGRIKISRPEANLGEAGTITDTGGLSDKIAGIREQLQTATGGGAGMGGNGGGNTTASASPDYGGLGDSGFNAKINENINSRFNNEPINVNVRADGRAGSATKPQQAIRFNRDKTIKNLNVTSRQYADLMGKSRSIDGAYEKIADRIAAENISQANIAQKTEAVLGHIENIKANAFSLADELGLTVDLGGIDNTIGLKPYQKKQLTNLGFNLNDIIGDKALSATQAEEVYKILRSNAYDLMGENSSALEKAAGKELNKAADEVSKRIDVVLDGMGVDFKKEFLNNAGIGGVDINGNYLRSINENGKPLKFSDLRREESDWIAISKVANRPLKEEKIPESMAEALGQAFKKGGEKIKEKYYEKVAGGAGGTGAGGGSVPPTGNAGAGASGEANNINFTTAPAGNSRLQNILARGKNVGLVGGGILGGLLLGGGGSGSDTVSGGTLGDMLQAQNAGAGSASTINDPYSTMTFGGYTYDQLESGYMAALQAGDSSAAKLILEMMGMLDDKIERYNNSNGTKNNGLNTAVAAVQQLEDLYNSIGDNNLGVVQGKKTSLLNTITGGGYNYNAANYESMRSGMLGLILKKGLSESGALSDADIQRAMNLLPSLDTNENAARNQFSQLYQLLQTASGLGG